MPVRHRDIVDMVTTNSDSIGVDDFHIRKVIGRGSFGKVYLVEHKDSGEIFAMKSIKKDVIVKAGMINRVLGKPLKINYS